MVSFHSTSVTNISSWMIWDADHCNQLTRWRVLCREHARGLVTVFLSSRTTCLELPSCGALKSISVWQFSRDSCKCCLTRAAAHYNCCFLCAVYKITLTFQAAAFISTHTNVFSLQYFFERFSQLCSCHNSSHLSCLIGISMKLRTALVCCPTVLDNACLCACEFVTRPSTLTFLP